MGFGWYSNSEPRIGRNFKHADDFMLSEAAAITRIAWWGQSSLDRRPDLTNFDSFDIEFFEAELVGGQWLPGESLASQTLTLAETSPVQTGRQTRAGAFEYRHEAQLAAPVALEAGRRYFLAVSAGLIDTSAGSDAWQWQDADFHDRWSASFSWATGAWTEFQDSDSAFILYAVPAPAALAPLTLTLAVVGSRRRRTIHP